MNANQVTKQQLSLATPVEQNNQVPSNFTNVASPESSSNAFIDESSFDQPVLLQQSPFWSRAIIWGIIGITTGVLVWANFAKIEEAIPAQGQLEPQGAVKEVQAPVGGVVKTLHVKEGQQVKKGDLLVSMTPTVPESQLKSLTDVRTSLQQENQFYRAQMQQSDANSLTGLDVANLKLPAELLSLAKSRNALVSENQVYRAELQGSSPRGSFTADENQRLQSSQAELNSRIAAAQLEVNQLEKQANQNRVQRSGAETQLAASLAVFRDIQVSTESKVAQVGKQLNQIQAKLTGARQVLQINQDILNDIIPVAKEGALSRIQLRKQEQEVATNQSEVNQLEQEQGRLQLEKSNVRAQAQVELQKQQQEASKHRTDANQLDQEYARLQLAMAQGREKLKNSVAGSSKDVQAKMALNQQRIAEIDSQLTKALVENQKRISEIDSQISQASLSLKYQEVRSPVNGKVFDIKAAGAGFVANASEPVMKIVPNDNLVAKVYITNKDIGFVKEGMDVDVRVDSFPFSEFGDIKGKLVSVGSDALEPDQIHPYYRFPVKVKIDQQFMGVKGKQVPLQSGMSLNTNIKLRSRTVMSIFTDLFVKQTESLKTVR